MNILSYKIKVYLLFLLLLTTSFSQNEPGARQSALSHSDVALSNDVFSLFNNVSGLAQLSKREIGFFYSPSPFGIKKLSTGFAVYNEPTSIGNFGLGIMTYGFDLYKENRIVLGYSEKISNNIFFGITTFYHTVSIKRYGKSNIFNISIGGLFKFEENFSLGFSLLNPLRYKNSKIELPIIYNLGISYKVKTLSSINIAIIKELNFPISIRFGIEYLIIKYLALRLGIQNKPSQYSGGIGIIFSFFNVDYSISSHQELGLTHQAGIRLFF